MTGASSALGPAAGLRGWQLLGRRRERGLLDRLLDGAGSGKGGVLVVHGEAGVGKTALLEYAVEAPRAFRVLRTVGVEGEMELPFAALQQLCAPILELSERLPPPQRDALGVALGLIGGPAHSAPNPFLVGLAVLGLMSEAAEERPLLCVVDDAQWLDRASARALSFVARRLLAEKIALLFAARGVGDALAGLPELHVEPLADREARALLESVLPSRLDERVVDRIVAEARGNPLALLEMPRGLTPAQLAGGFGLPTALPLSSQIEENFARRLGKLPLDAKRLLLLAAADPVGDPGLVWRAARRLRIPESAAEIVQSEGLLSLGARAAFRHPLVRSAVYRSSAPDQRREVHRALAEATHPEVDPDRRAWHRAQATSIPDAEVASELERFAARAQARGGFAAAAAFLERATALTPDESRRSGRALSAAQAKFQAGAVDDALDLLATAETGVLTDLERARVGLLRAQIAFVSRRGSDSPWLLLEAARELEPLDPSLARATYLEALSASMLAGRLARGGVVEVSKAALAGPPAPQAPRPSDLLLEGLAVRYTEGYATGLPILEEAVGAFRREAILAPEDAGWLWLASWVAMFLWDDAGWETLSERHVRLSRETGALSDLPLALSHRICVHLFAGELATAASLVAETQAATEATGSHVFRFGAVALVALRGREADAAYLIDSSRAEVTQRGEGLGSSMLDWAEAVLYNGLGRYEEARSAALRVAGHPQGLVASNWGMAELIEAAVRAGTPELAADAHGRLADMSRVSGTNWALGLAARCEALLVDGQRADDLYVEAIERLGRSRMTVDLARAHLLYGEWLRRVRRRVDARKELRVAHELFSDFGMEAFGERARVELEATGEHARRRSVETLDQLTPQESHVSRLAAQGNTNSEIAARLFISPSTVEYHLRKAFRKLDVKSRRQLANRLR